MTLTTNKTVENQNELLMELYNGAPCSVYNDQPVEKQTNMTTITT